MRHPLRGSRLAILRQAAALVFATSLVISLAISLVGDGSALAYDPPNNKLPNGKIASDKVYVRFRVRRPPSAPGEILHVTTGGFLHEANWFMALQKLDVPAGQWSPWLEPDPGKLLHWQYHRAGDLAEWPAMTLTVTHVGPGPIRPEDIHGLVVDLQLADAPDPSAIVIEASEHSINNRVGFLLPHPLRVYKKDFETGSQMAERQLGWARAAAGKKPVLLHEMTFTTTLWDHYDVGLVRKAVETLRWLGFNVVKNAPLADLAAAGMRTFDATWHWIPDPEQLPGLWKRDEEHRLAKAMPQRDGKPAGDQLARLVVSDEVQVLHFDQVPDVKKVNGWLRDWLRKRGIKDEELPRPIAEVEYPMEPLMKSGKALSIDADKKTRRLLYEAARWGQLWSVAQLRTTSDLAKASFPGIHTSTMPSSHSFMGAWGGPFIGMGVRELDLFELGRQRATDTLSVEDWLGLNHMYGPPFTWSGGQSYGYMNAITRSAIGAGDQTHIALITPSDERYLLLKAFSGLAQGAHDFEFWTFGPTFVSTENYFSDLRSEYTGIVRLGRMLEGQGEHLIVQSRPVHDAVAMLYAPSQDMWFADNSAAFVEKRLLWHALRHLGVQPDFLRDEELDAKTLDEYRVLYVTDWCVTKKTVAIIDAWVRKGGILYLGAGAASRDEIAEPQRPAFAEDVYPDGEAGAVTAMKTLKHAYNERVDLPTVPPIGHVKAEMPEGATVELPALGAILPLKTPKNSETFAHVVEDGAVAGVVTPHGAGTVVALGFMPMLAYGQLAGFVPRELAEKWPEGPRSIAEIPLTIAKQKPAGLDLAVHTDVPVVESALLGGPEGGVVVLANYTYHRIDKLRVDVHPPAGTEWTTARSVRHGPLRLESDQSGLHVKLPLDDVDLVLLTHSPTAAPTKVP